MIKKDEALVFKAEFTEEGDQHYIFVAAEDVDESEGLVTYYSIERNLSKRVDSFIEPRNTTTLNAVGHHHRLKL